MSKGKAKSKFDFENNKCQYEDNTWCKLPKLKRCEDCIRLIDGSKACRVTSF